MNEDGTQMVGKVGPSRKSRFCRCLDILWIARLTELSATRFEACGCFSFNFDSGQRFAGMGMMRTTRATIRSLACIGVRLPVAASVLVIFVFAATASGDDGSKTDGARSSVKAQPAEASN